jgi:uncharacterized protein YqfA (UPF0365 family)
MNDVTYAQNKARIIALREEQNQVEALREEQNQVEALREETMDEAVKRGEVFVLDYWYLHYQYQTAYFTLAEAIERAEDDCSPNHIVAPNGDLLDPYTGEKREVQR